jgi:hypothetical protein
MTLASQIESRVVPASVPGHRWHTAEAASSAASSASCYKLVEHIRIFAVIESERELRKVKRQIFLRYFVIAAHNPALQQTPEILDVVGMDVSAYIFARLMLDGFVRVEVLEINIPATFIGRDQVHFLGYGFLDKGAQGFSRSVLNHFADDITFAANRSDDGNLVFGATTDLFLSAMAVFILSTDVSFIHFNDAEQFGELFVVHCCADARAHIPDSFIASLIVENHSLDLKSAHPLLGMQHHEGDCKPSLQWVLGVLEDRPANQREAITLLAASLAMALPFPRLFELVNLIVIAAWTPCAIRPTVLEQELFAVFFGLKQGVQFDLAA